MCLHVVFGKVLRMLYFFSPLIFVGLWHGKVLCMLYFFGIVYALFVDFFFPRQVIVSLYALLQPNHLDGLQVVCLQGRHYVCYIKVDQGSFKGTTSVPRAHTLEVCALKELCTTSVVCP